MKKRRKILWVALIVLLFLLFFGAYFGFFIQVVPNPWLRMFFAAMGLALDGALLWVGRSRCREIKEENEDDYRNY